MTTVDETYWAGEIDAWVRYFARYVAGFGDNFVPASESDVRDLERRAGFTFPAELRALLRRMGRTPIGSLDPFMETYSYGVEAVAEFYADPPVPAPPGAVYLWTLGGDCEMFLDTSKEPPFPVICCEWVYDKETGKPVPGQHRSHIYHDCHSLMQFLYCEAFRFLRTGELPCRATLRRSVTEDDSKFPPIEERIGRFRQFAERLGFEPVPYMTGNLAYYNRDDASLMLYPSEYAHDSVHIDASSERELGRIRELLVDHLDLYVVGER